jgi:hypothetical protein
MPTERVAALVARLEKGRLKTQATFQPLTVAQWTRAVYEQPATWSARDLLAHFVSAEQSLLELAQDIERGGPGAGDDFDVHAFNAREQARLKDVTCDDLLAALAGARQATLAWVRTLEDSQLDRVGRHPALGDVTLETLITAIYGHQLLHVRDLLRALA